MSSKSLKEKLESDPKPNYLQYTLDLLACGHCAKKNFRIIQEDMEKRYGVNHVEHYTHDFEEGMVPKYKEWE